MKVIGQLERAQLEQSTPGTLPGPASTGRVYADVTAPAAAIPRFYNGSAWVPFLMGQNTAFVQQTSSSGGTVTVNWANGLNQEVILGGHTTIQFSNPQPGQVHVLAVTQRSTEAAGTTPWMYCFNMPDQETRRQPYINKGVLQSSESAVYSWFYSTAIKPAYATIPGGYGGPGFVAFTQGNFGIDVSIDGKTVYTATLSTPFGTISPVYDGGGKLLWGGVGSLPGSASLPPSACAGPSVSPDGSSIFYALAATPFISGRGLVANNAVSNFSNPATLPTGATQCIDVHPSGSHVVVGHATTPFMSCYPILSGTFGARVIPATTLPAAQVNAVAWAPTGDFLAVGSQTTPFLQVYTFDPFTGFGATPIANPVTLPGGGPFGGIGRGISWHPSGNWIAMISSVSPYIYIVAFNRATATFGSVVTVSLVSGPASANCLRFSPCGNYLFVGCNADLFVYDTSALPTFGPFKVAYDSAGPGVQVLDVAFHPSGELFFLALGASPWIAAWPMPRKQKNYLKLNF